MILRRFAAVTLSAGLFAVVPVLPAQADPLVVGTACGTNEGVTVVVDFAPARDEVAVGCAPGLQDTIEAAVEAAGFEVTSEVTGFGPYLCAIDGVAANPANCQAFPGAYWASWLATADGTPGGPAATTFSSAQVGLSGGPLALGSIVGFNQNTDGSFPGTPPRLDLTALPPRDNTPVDVPAYGPGAGSATAVAGWLGRQLDAGNGLINGNAGLTVDAVYALAAAGVGGDTIDRAAAALLDSATSYIGTPDQIPANFAKIAKLALALQIAEIDPATVPDGAGGTRDLLTELRSTLNADGSFGTDDDPFQHAYALLALGRTGAGAPEAAVAWLAAQQCDNGAATGAFGFDDSCANPDPDYTAVAVEGLLAGGLTGDDEAVAAATAWLTAQQGVAGDLSGNTNSTGLAGNAFAAVGATEAATAAAGFIGGLQVTCDTLVDSALTPAEVGAIAWTPAGLADAAEFGLDEGNLGEWQYASVQAVLGLGAPALAELTAAGADDALPPAPTCAAPGTEPSGAPTEPSTEPVTPTVPSAPAPAGPTVSAAPIVTAPGTVRTAPQATPVLASTGVDDSTGAEVAVAVLLLITGSALVFAARRPRASRSH